MVLSTGLQRGSNHCFGPEMRSSPKKVCTPLCFKKPAKNSMVACEVPPHTGTPKHGAETEPVMRLWPLDSPRLGRLRLALLAEARRQLAPPLGFLLSQSAPKESSKSDIEGGPWRHPAPQPKKQKEEKGAWWLGPFQIIKGVDPNHAID